MDPTQKRDIVQVTTSGASTLTTSIKTTSKSLMPPPGAVGNTSLAKDISVRPETPSAHTAAAPFISYTQSADIHAKPDKLSELQAFASQSAQLQQPQLPEEIKSISNIDQQQQTPLRSVTSEPKKNVQDYVKNTPAAKTLQDANGKLAEALKMGLQKGSVSEVAVSQRISASTSEARKIPVSPQSDFNQLTLSQQQENAINMAKVYLASTVSCLIKLPVIYQSVAGLQVFSSGLELGNQDNREIFPDALLIRKEESKIIVGLRTAGTDSDYTTVTNNPAELLKRIPQHILGVKDGEEICAIFQPATTNYIEAGMKSYAGLVKSELKHAKAARENPSWAKTYWAILDSSYKTCNELAAKFAKPGTAGMIFRKSLFRTMEKHLQQQPESCFNITALVLEIFGLPEPELLHALNDNMLGLFCSDSGAANRLGCIGEWLYSLATWLPDDQIFILDKAVKDVLSILEPKKSLQEGLTEEEKYKHQVEQKKEIPDFAREVFKMVRKHISRGMEEESITRDETRNKIITLCNRFDEALKKSNFSSEVQYHARENLLPFIIITKSTDDFIKESLPVLKSNYNKTIHSLKNPTYKNEYGITDSLLALFISSSLPFPDQWSEYITNFYFTVINELGQTGDLPFACIELIEYTNIRFSPERAKEILTSFIGKYIKANNTIRTLSALMVKTLSDDELANTIYKAKSDKLAIENFINIWQKIEYFNSTNKNISEETCFIHNQSGIFPVHKNKINNVAGTKLDHKDGIRTIEKINNIVKIVITNKDCTPILVERLCSLSQAIQKEELIKSIVNISLQAEGNKAGNITSLNNRLQENVDSRLAILTRKKNHTACNQLLRNLSLIQIRLLEHTVSSYAIILRENLIRNLSAIGELKEITMPLVKLKIWLTDNRTAQTEVETEEKNRTFLEIIAQVVEKSKIDAIRETLLKTAFGSIPIDLLLRRLAESSKKKINLSRFELFTDIVNRQMLMTPDSGNPGTSKMPEPLNDKQLQALTTFLTSSPDAWKIFVNAYNKSPGKTEWIMEPKCFLNASPEVQEVMLGFLVDKVSTETVGWINQYLDKIESWLIPPLKNAPMLNLESSLFRICNCMQKISHHELPELVIRIFKLSNTIMAGKVKPTISVSLNGSLHMILKRIETTSVEIHEQLSMQYETLLKPDQSLAQEFRTTPDNTPRSNYRMEQMEQIQQNPNTTTVKETQILNDGQEKPRITRTIYVDKMWERYISNKDLTEPLNKAISKLETGENDHELNTHKYNKGVFSFDVCLGWGGRGVTRGVAFIGPRNDIYIIKIGNHREVEIEANKYSHMEKSYIYTLINKPELNSRILSYDKEKEQYIPISKEEYFKQK
ncbi:hypothetical protein J2125_003525 [Erwinia toletana]|uniref:Uncharacterized protein n=1 Tax=Winslowiella toletana TaxID=92490 RepID=A0ABS4PCG2_9GAMM|nr:hypothetical protein [Winslowiella toletana]MBP2170333.1 hypothetical protein [Winslowiella toletana]